MKEIKLIKLELKNFKGIREFTFEPNGRDINVFGKNKTGKTTLMDGFLWLLFGKDSRGQAQFDIKTKDEDGNVIHGLEHTVRGTLRVDNREIDLERTYREKWQKKKGSNNERFTGHTTDYKFNGSPIKKKEYEQRINEIIDEDIFRLLTDPRYFNEQLHWEDRRELLIEVCGDIDHEDIIDQDERLEKLSEVLDKRSIDEHQKKLKSEMDEINNELEKIPVRIDEAQQNLPDVSGLDWKEIEQDIQTLKEAKKEKEKELNRIESGGEISEKKKRLSEIETELIELKNEYNSDRMDRIQELREERSEIKEDIDELNSDIDKLKRKKKTKKIDITEIENENDRLRDEFKELQEEKEELQSESWDGDKACSACGQELPKDQIEEAREKYNKQKAERITEINDRQQEINEEGKSNNQSIEELQSIIEDTEDQIYKLSDQKEGLKEDLEDINTKIENLKEKANQEPESDEYQQKFQEKEDLQQQIQSLKKDRQESISEIEEKIAETEADIEVLQDKLSDIKQHNKGQDRIEELKEREEELAEQYEKLEEEMHLTEEYTRTKVKLLEEKINEHFDHTQFKLFEEQLNGGIKETCVALDAEDGAAFGNSLNAGSEYKIGIDIINRLSDYYGFRAPIFVDNRESITEPIKTGSQLISLIVSPEDDRLRVEEAEKPKTQKEAS